MTEQHVTIAEAIEAWETRGATSLTFALVVDALYGAAEARARVEAVPDWLLENGADPQTVEFMRANLTAALAEPTEEISP
jgi:hypothetical protein